MLRKLRRRFFKPAPGLGPAPRVEHTVVETHVTHPGVKHGSVSSRAVTGRALTVDHGGINGLNFEKDGFMFNERSVVEQFFFVVALGVIKARKMRRPRVAGFAVSEVGRRAVVVSLRGIRLRPTKRGAKIEKAEGQRRRASKRVESSVGKLARSSDRARVVN